MNGSGGKRRKIGRLIFLIMAVSFVLVLAVVHLVLNRYIRARAEEAILETTEKIEYEVWKTEDGDGETGQIEYAVWNLEEVDGEQEDSMFEVVSVVVSSEYAEDNWDWGYYTGETELIGWCREHPETDGKTVKAAIGDSTYYVKQERFRYQDIPEWYWNDGHDADDENIRISSVNVTSAIWMISLTEILLAMVMAACTAVATWLGYRTDRAVEQEQEKQKRFFENASHELKTPLMSIRGYAEGLQKGILPDQDHALEVINEEVNTMAGLVDDILALSKADRGLDELRKEKISVGELVGDCLDTLEAEIRRRELQVKIDIEDRFVVVDVDKMKRAVTNILANAIRYAETELRITFLQDTLQILDDGRPLTEDEQKHLFERFHTGEGGSTGIGMALAKEIAEQHGILLTVENAALAAQDPLPDGETKTPREEPRGVCFRMRFPDLPVPDGR